VERGERGEGRGREEKIKEEERGGGREREEKYEVI